MEYKNHTAMAPQDAKEAIEKYKKKRRDKDAWLSIVYHSFHYTIRLIFKWVYHKIIVFSRLDEVNELAAVSVSLFSKQSEEYQDNDVILPVFGILDDGISNNENGSEILGAVASQKEGDSSVFNGVS